MNELPRPVVQEPGVDVLIVASLGRCHVVLEPQPTIDEVSKVRGVVRKVVLFEQMNEVLEVKLDSVVLQNEKKLSKMSFQPQNNLELTSYFMVEIILSFELLSWLQK